MCVTHFSVAQTKSRADSLATGKILSLKGSKAYQADSLSEAIGYYFQSIRLLEKLGDKETLPNVYQSVGDIYASNDLFEKAITYYTKAVDLEADNLLLQESLGDAYFQQRSYEAALDAYSSAKELALQQELPKYSLMISERIIACYHGMEQYDRALQNEEITLATARRLGDSLLVATTLNNIGYAYKYTEDYKSALKYFKQSLKLHEKLNSSPIDRASVMLNISIVYQNMGDYDNSLSYILKAIALIEKSEDREKIATMYDLAASVYYAENDYHNAQYYSEAAIETAKPINDVQTLESSYLTASLVHQQYDEFQEALDDYKRHLEIKDSLLLVEKIRQQTLLQQQVTFERSEREIEQLISAKEVSELARKQQELAFEKQKKELEFARQEKKLQEARMQQQQLEEDKAKQQLLLTRQLLQTEKTAREVELLKQQETLRKNELEKSKIEEQKQKLAIEKLEADNALKAEENERQKEQAAAQQRFYLTLAGLLSVVIALILFSFWSARNKNKQLAQQQAVIEERNVELSQMNEEIVTQRDVVAQANDQLNLAIGQITDSVRYAQRIQNSILVPPAEIVNKFEDGFVFFEPRDIVSGDFYWFAEVQNEAGDDLQIIAAVDCTGHGVPGAFMSLIGNDLLNDIVNLKQIHDPAEILEELSEGVRRTLKQEQTANQDGMDMALCTINKKAKTLTFAGAKNPLVYIQNGEIHQIKGNKMPIGGKKLYGDQSFTNHQVSLETPLHCYIFSDGFQDQFGGPDGRKFMVKRFRGLLQEIHQKPMSQQKEILADTLKGWRGNEKQLDDVLVMGFKV